MCSGGIYLDIATGKLIKVYFPIPNAIIPFIDDCGNYYLAQWGQRESDKNLLKDLPITGWARKESLGKTFWIKHNPKKVLIPFKSFFEKDRTSPVYPKNKSSEFKLEVNQYLLGLNIKLGDRNFVYPVTRSIDSWIHDRYPVIVSKLS